MACKPQQGPDGLYPFRELLARTEDPRAPTEEVREGHLVRGTTQLEYPMSHGNAVSMVLGRRGGTNLTHGLEVAQVIKGSLLEGTVARRHLHS